MRSLKLFYIIFVLILCSCSSLSEKANQVKDRNILSSPDRNTQSVYLTKNHLGQPIMVWAEQDTSENKEKHCFFSVWNNSSASFKDRIEILIEQSAALHIEGMPKVAFKKSGEIIAAYDVKVKSDINPHAGEIHYISSTDNGKTWSAPQLVHASNAPNKSRSFFDMITLTTGEVGACWLGESTPGGGRPVMFAKTKAGNSFTNETIVDSSACQCCRTAIHSDNNGMISIVYRDIVNDSIRDISVVVSKDNGKTFSTPVCFSGDNWNINGCPHNGPDVVSDQNNIYAVWYTGASEKGVYFAQLDKQNLKVDKKRVSENGKHIQLITGEGSPIMVYDENYSKDNKYYSKIKLVTIPEMKEKDITEGDIHAQSPVAVAFNNDVLISWLEEVNGVNVVKTRTVANK